MYFTITTRPYFFNHFVYLKNQKKNNRLFFCFLKQQKSKSHSDIANEPHSRNVIVSHINIYKFLFCVSSTIISNFEHIHKYADKNYLLKPYTHSHTKSWTHSHRNTRFSQSHKYFYTTSFFLLVLFYFLVFSWLYSFQLEQHRYILSHLECVLRKMMQKARVFWKLWLKNEGWWGRW